MHAKFQSHHQQRGYEHRSYSSILRSDTFQCLFSIRSCKYLKAMCNQTALQCTQNFNLIINNEDTSTALTHPFSDLTPSSASSPLEAVNTSKPCAIKLRCNARKISISSSTTRIRAPLLLIHSQI